jgi:hypothetical protein
VTPITQISAGQLLALNVAANYDVDHVTPLARHWSELNGNNSEERVRKRIAGGRENLRLMWGPLNRARGAEGATYVRHVLRGFASEVTARKGPQWADENARFANYE